MKKRILAFAILPIQVLVINSAVKILEPEYPHSIVLLLPSFFTVTLLFFVSINLHKTVLKHDWQFFKRKKMKLFLFSFLGAFLFQHIMNAANDFMIYLNMFNYPVSLEANVTLQNLHPIQVVFLPIIKVYYLLTTINEELYFRYNFLYSNHKRKLTSLFLLILSSILFGMAHYFFTNSLIGTFPYIIGGLFLGLIYFKTKNIYYVIGIHFFNNLIYGLLQWS